MLALNKDLKSIYFHPCKAKEIASVARDSLSCAEKAMSGRQTAAQVVPRTG